jgi:RNA polymerase sigma-70 factor (ECF subfamily)
VRGLDRFDERSSFKTWTYRVATNAALDELRRRRRRPEPGLPVAALTSRGTDAALDHGVATRLDVDAALACLPTEFRAPVVLRDLCTLSYDEIAEVLDIPPGTVRSRIARGRAALADMLRDEMTPGPAGPGGHEQGPTGPGGHEQGPAGNPPGGDDRPKPAHE